MLNQIITVCVGLGILGVAYLTDTIAALANVFGSHTTDKFSWKKLGRGVIKVFLWTLAIVGITVELNLLEWFTTRLGINIAGELAGFDTLAILSLVIGACVGYTQNTIGNIKYFIENKTSVVKIDTDGIIPDYKAIAEDVIEFADSITPDWQKEPQEDNEDIEKIEEEAITPENDEYYYSESEQEELNKIYERLDKSGEGLGGSSPLSRRLKDGSTSYQCTRYAYYLATGILMNYRPHPDYGPCNGRDLVDFLVNNYGFIRCGKEDGVIFSYDNSYYGHCGYVLRAKDNLVNDANYIKPLAVGTHKLPLDKLGCKYCKPKGEVKIFHIGDRVELLERGNTKPDGTGKTYGKIGSKQYILNKVVGAKYPYVVGSTKKSKKPTAYFKKRQLEKVK